MNAYAPQSGSARNGQEDVGGGWVRAAAVRAALQQALAHDEARVLCLGDGPFTRRNMAAFLAAMGVAPLDLRSALCPTLLVCGRANLNADRVQELMYVPHRAPVLCAQEQVLHACYQLWEERSGGGLIKLGWHPVQRWLTPPDVRQEDTTPAEGPAAASTAIFCPDDLLRMLPYVEYAMHGTQARRRKVLRQAFVMDLRALKHIAPASDARRPAAVHSWGQGRSPWGLRRSATRLQHVVGSLMRAQQRLDGLHAPLRSICSKDLRWLRINMYDAGGFDFPWPAA